jgi:hypothetical protein
MTTAAAASGGATRRTTTSKKRRRSDTAKVDGGVTASRCGCCGCCCVAPPPGSVRAIDGRPAAACPSLHGAAQSSLLPPTLRQQGCAHARDADGRRMQQLEA